MKASLDRRMAASRATCSSARTGCTRWKINCAEGQIAAASQFLQLLLQRFCSSRSLGEVGNQVWKLIAASLERCPKCHSKEIMRSHRRNPIEHALSVVV